jgi:hypothetical protein
MVSSVLIVCGIGNAAAQDLSIENQFAYMNEGKWLQANDPAVAKAKILLDRASEQYGQPQKEIADYAFRTSEVMKKEGIEESPMNVLQATVLLANDRSVPLQGYYKIVLSQYMSLREKGSTSEEAVASLRAFFRGIASTNPKRKN